MENKKKMFPLLGIEPRFLGVQPLAIPAKLLFIRYFNASGRIEYDRFGTVTNRGIQKLLPVAAKKDDFTQCCHVPLVSQVNHKQPIKSASILPEINEHF